MQLTVSSVLNGHSKHDAEEGEIGERDEDSITLSIPSNAGRKIVFAFEPVGWGEERVPLHSF